MGKKLPCLSFILHYSFTRTLSFGTSWRRCSLPVRTNFKQRTLV